MKSVSAAAKAGILLYPNSETKRPGAKSSSHIWDNRTSLLLRRGATRHEAAARYGVLCRSGQNLQFRAGGGQPGGAQIDRLAPGGRTGTLAGPAVAQPH